MRTFIKIIAACAAAAVLAGVALAVFAKILITPERIRAAVVPVAEKALDRDVHLGDISVHFFSGIILHDLHITERVSKETFIRADRASLRYSLLPLLSLKIVINEIRLEEPQIRIERRSDGTFNFSDLGTADSAPGRAAGRTDTAADSGGPPVSLTIATVRVQRGSLLFTDAAAGTAKPLQHRIEKLNITAGSIALDGAFPFELNCLINAAPLSIQGSADASGRSGRARIRLDNLDTAPFMPYVAGLFPGRVDGLVLSLDAECETDTAAFASRGTLTLADISLVLDVLPEAPVSNARLQAEFNIRADMQASALLLDSLRLDLNGIIAQVAGRIESLDTVPRLAIDAQLPDLDIAAALAALPAGLVAGASGLKPAGTIDIMARIEGPADRGTDLLKNARVRMDNVQATLGSMRPALNGILNLAGDRLSSQDLVIDTPAGRARMDLTAGNLFSTPISTTQNISAERLNFDALLQALSGDATDTTGAQAPPGAGTAEEAGPFDLPVRANGTVNVTQAVYRGLTIDDLHMTYRLVDNVLHIENMNGRAANGSFSQNARVDLGRRGLAYQGALKVTSMQTDPLVSAFMPKLAKTFSGLLSLDIEAAGKGTLPDTIKKNLDCTTRMDMADGRIRGIALAQGLAAFLDIDELRELRFDSFSGTADIERGQARIDSKLTGTDVRMKPQGVIGLDGALDMNLEAALSPELMKKVDKHDRFSRVLADQQGWGRIPLTVRGSLDQPRFGLDAAGLQKQAVDSLQQRLLERLAPKEQPAQEPEAAPAQERTREQTPQPDQPAGQETRKERRKRKKQEKREERRQLIEGVLNEVLSP